MKCQSLFSGEYKKNINLLSAEFVQRVVKVKTGLDCWVHRLIWAGYTG